MENIEHHVHHISKGMHYATMAALIISNLTVLGLAALIAGPLFGRSLGELSSMGYTAKAQNAVASLGNYYYSGSDQIKFQGNGTLVEISDVDNILNESIYIADAKRQASRGTNFSFDAFSAISSTPIDLDSSSDIGRYFFNAPLTATLGNYEFTPENFYVNVYPNDPISSSDRFVIAANNFNYKKIHIDTLSIHLQGPSGLLQDDTLPDTLNIAGFDNATFYVAGSLTDNNGEHTFYVSGDVANMDYYADYEVPASLSVNVGSLPAAQSVVQYTNQFHTTNIEFDASDSGQDVNVTQIVLSATSVAPAYPGIIQRCAFYNGPDLIPSVSAQIQYFDAWNDPGGRGTNYVGIQSGDLTIPKGTTKTVAVKCDVGSGSGGSFAVGLFPYSIVAVDENGASVDVQTTAGTGQSMSVIESGSLYISIAQDPRSSLVIGGQTVDVGSFTAQATGEDMIIHNLGVSIEPPDFGIAGSYDVIDRLELWEAGGGSPLGSISVNTRYATITPYSGLFIGQNMQKRYILKARFNDLSPYAPASSGDGARVQLQFINVDGVSAGSSNVSVIGLGIPFKSFTAFKSLPYVSLQPGTQDTIVIGDVSLFTFAISADASGPVSLAKLSFRVQQQNVTLDPGGFKVYQSASPYAGWALLSDANDTTTTGPGGTIVEARFDPDQVMSANTPGSGEQYILSAGATRYFKLTGRVTGRQAGYAQSISTSLAGDGLPVTVLSSYPDIDGSVHDDFIWSDLNFDLYATSSATQYAGWFNGFRVSGLDSDYSTPQVITD